MFEIIEPTAEEKNAFSLMFSDIKKFSNFPKGPSCPFITVNFVDPFRVFICSSIVVPLSIIGMLLLTLFLKLGWIKLQWVQGLSDFLVANLGFFFVPPGVALMLYFDVIEAQFWPIVIATVVSTVLVLVVTGWVHQLVRKSNGIFRK